MAQSTIRALQELAGHPHLTSIRLHATSWTSKLLHAKNDIALRPSGVRAGPVVRSADMPSGSVLTIEIGSLFSIGIIALQIQPEAMIAPAPRDQFP